MRVVLLAAAVLAAAVAALRLASRGPRYAYGRWRDPDVLVPGAATIFDGP